MDNIFLKAVNLSLTAGVIVLVVLLGRLLLGRVLKAPRWVLCLLWIIVALRLVIPWTPKAPFGILPADDIVSIGRVDVVPEGSDVNIPYTANVPVVSTGIAYANNSINPGLAASMTPAVGDSADPIQIVLSVGTVVWLVGVLAMLVYMTVSWLRVKRRVREAVPAGKGIFETDRIETPFILGIFKPAIYIPVGLDERRLQVVMAHERAHIERRDHWWKPLGFLLLAVYWFNPLLWLAYVLLCRDIEMACDEKVIVDMEAESKKEYSETLFSLSVPHRMIAACPVAFGEVGVKGRIRNVLNYRKPAFWIIIVAVVTCVVLGVVLLTGRSGQSSGTLYRHYFSDKNGGADYKDTDKVRKFLGALPKDRESLENGGILVTSLWGSKENKQEVWNRFADRINRGESAVLTVADYTDEGDPIFQYLYYDGTGYWYAYDNTRDKFGSPQEITLEYYHYLYSFIPTESEFEVILADIGGLTYLQFLDMVLYYDIYADQLQKVRTIAEMWDVEGLTGIGGENGYLPPRISENGFVNGTYLNTECLYVSPVSSEMGYPGGTIYVFTDEGLEMYSRYDTESGPVATEVPESAEWEDFYTDAEWKSFFKLSGEIGYRNDFEDCKSIKKMRYGSDKVLILADERLYIARITDIIWSLYRLLIVEDRGSGPSYTAMIPSNAGLAGVYADYFFVPIGNASYRYRMNSTNVENLTKDSLLLSCVEKDDFGGECLWEIYSLKEYPGHEAVLGICEGQSYLLGYCPSQGISEQEIEAVKTGEFVVMENGSAVSGKLLWEAFLAETQAGNSATVNIAFVYRQQDMNMSNKLSIATQEDYPCMYCNRLTFDGNRYIIEPLNKSGEDYVVYERSGIDSPAATYKYLMHYTGKPSSRTARFISYDKYVLTNDDSVTWNDIEKGMLSSQMGAWIDHREVYNEYEWKTGN